MKKLLILLCIVSIPAIVFAQREIDVYIIGGQSNATGQGLMRNIPASFEIDGRVYIYYSKYLTGGKSAECWTGLCQASDRKEKFGVELSLGTALKRYFPHREIALIKHSLSGSNLFAQWNPGNRAGEKQGEEYAKWLDTVNEALKALKAMGFEPIVRAMVWQQGEADAREVAGLDNSRNYGENLKNFILQVRDALSAPDMLFVFGEVMPLPAARFPGRTMVRNAQIAVSEHSCTPLSVKNAIWVEGDDLQMLSTDYQTPAPTDDVHLGTFGLLNLGERFAKVIYDNLKTGIIPDN